MVKSEITPKDAKLFSDSGKTSDYFLSDKGVNICKQIKVDIYEKKESKAVISTQK